VTRNRSSALASVCLMFVATISPWRSWRRWTVDSRPAARALGGNARIEIHRATDDDRPPFHPVFTGHVRVEDLIIDGLHPGDRPFFTANVLRSRWDWGP